MQPLTIFKLSLCYYNLLFKLNTIPNLLIRGKLYHLQKCGDKITEVLEITLYLPLKVERLQLKLGYNDGNDIKCTLDLVWGPS